jgi:hypothetical protein
MHFAFLKSSLIVFMVYYFNRTNLKIMDSRFLKTDLGSTHGGFDPDRIFVILVAEKRTSPETNVINWNKAFLFCTMLQRTFNLRQHWRDVPTHVLWLLLHIVEINYVVQWQCCRFWHDATSRRCNVIYHIMLFVFCTCKLCYVIWFVVVCVFRQCDISCFRG